MVPPATFEDVCSVPSLGEEENFLQSIAYCTLRACLATNNATDRVGRAVRFGSYLVDRQTNENQSKDRHDHPHATFGKQFWGSALRKNQRR
mmetsp:Transcript_55107/g.165059  ORF Transcript_55107/g.165059 Transcript_55107/m.165059 type:complete len:91 (+) Transcript_55107:887-1159(+)